MNLAVVIPCYNVARHIEDVLCGIPEEAEWRIAVDDASSDETQAILKRLAAADSRIIYIRHEKNKGVGGAMMTGYGKAIELQADIIVKVDGDGQMDMADIPALIQPLLDNKADYAKGNRFRDLHALRKMPFGRRIGNLGLSFMIKAASGYWNIFDPSNGFTAIQGDMLNQIDFKKIHPRYFFESSMLIELYYANAVIQDVPMKAKYGNEISGLSITRTLFEFPPRLFIAWIKRVLLKYFLFEFNIASVYILTGLPLFLAGAIYGGVNFFKYASSHIPAPTGTVVIPTLLIVLGFQLLLSAVNYDIENYPKR